MMMTAAPGLSAKPRSMLARTARLSTWRFSIQIWLLAAMPTWMLEASVGAAVSALGRVTSTPDSLTKVEVTMKKMSMMNTTSSIGVRSMGLSSSSSMKNREPSVMRALLS